MDSNSILDKKFLSTMNGYKKEDVDEFLSDVAHEFSLLKKENEDLEKKLQVCADKIREYREDEDALKDALLGAQKQGNAIISESKAKGAKIISDAEEKSTEMMQEADDYVTEKKAEAAKIVSDALAEKKRIEDEARKQADDIHAEMMIQTELDKEVLERTKREAEDFRTRIIIEYNNHIEFIKSIPEQCENEFVRNNSETHNTNTLRELIASQSGAPAPEIPEANDAEEEDRDSDIKIADDLSVVEVSENDSEEIEEEEEEFDEQSAGGFTVDNAFGTQSSSAPDFLGGKPQKNLNSKYDKLEFGGNTSAAQGRSPIAQSKKKRR